MCSLQAHYHQWRGHSCPVTRMLFLASDTHLLTTGSRDFCILQWTVEGKLPVVNEEEESNMDNEVAHTGRHQIKDNHKLSDNESYHSDYSPDEQEDDDYEYSKNVTRGKQARGRQQPSENSRYSDAADSLPQAPQGRGRPLRKSHHLDYQGEDTRAVGRSPRRNIPAQDTRSQQGSYAERFNKHKATSNARWNPQSSSDPQHEPEDMGLYSDEESPRQQQGHTGRGRGRSRHPARGQIKEWTRRPMR